MDATALSVAEVVAYIRARCPWAAAHTHRTLLPYLIEETYELIAAVESGQRDDVEAELGDVLYQVLFHAALLDDPTDDSEAAGTAPVDPNAVRSLTGQPVAPAAFGRVGERLRAKLVRRHPHVFDSTGPVPLGEVERRYEAVKAQERAIAAAALQQSGDGAQAGEGTQASEVPVSLAQRLKESFASIPPSMPALSRAAAVLSRIERLEVPLPDARPQGDSQSSGTGDSAPVPAPHSEAGSTAEAQFGEQLFDLVLSARAAGVDLEAALRAHTRTVESTAIARATGGATTNTSTDTPDLN